MKERKKKNYKMDLRKNKYGNVSYGRKKVNYVFNNNNTLEFYTDGSCMPNPGPGGCAVYCPKYEQLNMNLVITHDTTINYAELSAIEQVLLSIEENFNFIYGKEVKNIAIFTDSLFVMNNLRYNHVNEIKYYYDLIESIFGRIGKLNQFNFAIIKVTSHNELKGNMKVDDMAKKAAEDAIKMKENEGNSLWNNKNMPAIVSVAMFNELISEKYKKLKQEKWRKYKTKLEMRVEENEIFEEWNYVNERLFMKAMFKNDNYDNKLNENGKCLFEEMRSLRALQAEIIMKLRTETAHLNYFLFKQYKLPDTNGNCLNCGTKETVSHYLLDCDKYKKQRKRLRDSFLTNEKEKWNVPFFAEEKNWTAINLLFPHVWQQRPNPKEIKKDKYKEMCAELLSKRLITLNNVAKFVINTKRFESDIGI